MPIARQPEPVAIGRGGGNRASVRERVRDRGEFTSERAVAVGRVIADQSVPDAVSDRMLREAQATN